MAPEGVAICWGLKEPTYGASPLLPALDQVLPQELAALEHQVSEGHAVHGSEISFYWCFPFWVLAAQLQPQGISVAGLSDFEAAGRSPQLIVLVDLPLQRSGLQRLMSRYQGVPLVLLVAETPLERQAQHCGVVSRLGWRQRPVVHVLEVITISSCLGHSVAPLVYWLSAH